MLKRTIAFSNCSFLFYCVMKNKRFISALILDLIVISGFFAAPYLLRLLMNKVSNCWSMEMGFICPACGGTRCLTSLLVGDVLSAIKYNPIVFLIMIYLSVIFVLFNVSVFIKWKFADKLLTKLTNYHIIIYIAIAFVVVGLLRNFVFVDFFSTMLSWNNCILFLKAENFSAFCWFMILVMI